MSGLLVTPSISNSAIESLPTLSGVIFFLCQILIALSVNAVFENVDIVVLAIFTELQIPKFIQLS